MTWTKLGDDFADRLEDLELTPTACWLHTAALIYCNRVGSDGRVPFSKIGKVASIAAPETHVAELEQAGLWLRTEDDGAWQIDWTDQEPAEEVRARREYAAEKQRRYRQRLAKHRRGDHSDCDPTRCKGVTSNATGNGTSGGESVEKPSEVSTGVTSHVTDPRPDPSRPGPEEPGKGRGHLAATALRCPIPGHDGRSGVDAEGDPHCGACADARPPALPTPTRGIDTDAERVS